MYGRFGMHVDNTRAQILTHGQAAAILNSYVVTNVIPLGGLKLISYIVNPSVSFTPQGQGWRRSGWALPGQTNVPIAAAITAYSRMLINEFKLLAMDLGLDLYYSDTDSLVVNGALPEQYIDSATLGQLKLEHVLEEGYFVAPKVYWLKTGEWAETHRIQGKV